MREFDVWLDSQINRALGTRPGRLVDGQAGAEALRQGQLSAAPRRACVRAWFGGARGSDVPVRFGGVSFQPGYHLYADEASRPGQI